MPHSINEAEILIDNLLSYYNVSTYSDLALKIGTTQANISSWKIRNSINAIKNKCKELGIYNDIFGDSFNTFTQTGANFTPVIKNEIKINDILLEQAKNEASKFGLDINSYIEHLIIQDLKK